MATKTRGMDPPAENRTLTSDDEKPESDDSEPEEPVVEAPPPTPVVDKKRDDRALKTLPEAATNAQPSGEPSSSDSTTESTKQKTTVQKSKRTSYSKESLNPTQQGDLIQAGVDPGASTDADKKPHQPAYISKQLKATGYGDKIKQGAAVPRDHIAQPVDPNDSLADVYKSQSTKFKATGFAEKLKEGCDVPRDHVAAQDPNDKLGDMYKSVTKSTGLGEKLKKGEDVRAAAPVDKTDQTTVAPYASLKLKKTQEPKPTKDDDKNKKYSAKILETVKLQKTETIVKDPTVHRASLPEVKLQKTTTVVKDGKSAKFELPDEFAKAKDKLKRRKGSHWYSGEVPTAKPAKKWFFQKGEWDDGTTAAKPASKTQAKKSSWFFGGSSSTSHVVAEQPLPNKSTPAPAIFRGSKTMLNTHKPTIQHYHIVPEEKKGKSAVKPFNKNYYNEIQRRRGLEPKMSRGSGLCTLLMVMVVVPLLCAVTLHYGNEHYPEQTEQLWQTHVEPMVEKARPHVDPVWERVQPHVQMVVEHVQPHVEYAVEKAQPHFTALVEKAHPLAVSAVDRVCGSVEALALPEQHEKWLKPAHNLAMDGCTWTRNGLTPSEQSEEDETEELKKECDCDSLPQRKGLNKLLPRRRKEQDDNECHCGADEL
ncbi:expressed unknown protein [Seminavis robusta]|uniref:Uncharacterized protein n=1 Tax=Seminavis robusta TaxID=568900 RepID=A0A9N8DNP1_9STRA|nr:expressed unknown protein [Seminavis robusta]|eukprot:Sro179_g078530.1 n/a (648) ;mRNA; f:58731-60674